LGLPGPSYVTPLVIGVTAFLCFLLVVALIRQRSRHRSASMTSLTLLADDLESGMDDASFTRNRYLSAMSASSNHLSVASVSKEAFLPR
jgi:hypothetical protein